MSVLSRDALEKSPLADLHTIAAELGLDGFRRLRKADLIAKILGEEPAEEAGDGASEESEERPRARRGRRGGRGRSAAAADADDESDADADDAVASSDDDGDDEEERTPRRRSRSRRSSTRDSDDEPAPRRSSNGNGNGNGDEPSGRRRRGGDDEEREAEGVVDLGASGSGFLRVDPSGPSDDDVYISAAQIRRCELVDGDRVAGPVRPPRRSERYPSLIRVETINGKPADEVVEGTRFDDLPVGYPTERFAFGSDDVTLKAIEGMTPFGRGSRVTIVGRARAGKSQTLRGIAAALRQQNGLEVSIVLAGVRPEEVDDWAELGVDAASAQTLGASPDAQAQAIERAIDAGRRTAARGGDAVVIVDTVAQLPLHIARRALGAARNVVDGGSLTVVATAAEEIGGETTVIALDAARTAIGSFPALDLAGSGTLRPELLVGQAGADAIAETRAKAEG